jgi:MFS family permease
LTEPRLGLAANWRQFALLVAVNALVGATIGLERSIIPSLAKQEFGLDSYRAVLSFIVVFGIAKALANYAAGQLADRVGRKPLLVVGWLLALPVPVLLIWAPSWAWILAANALLGISQGLTWSMTVVMKVDIVGAERRGLAMGLNEFAGYLALAASAVATATIAAEYGLRPWPFVLGGVLVVLGLLSSVLFVAETKVYAASESRSMPAEPVSSREAFGRTTWRDRDLSAVTQAGFVNNLNDGMAWGLFPMLFVASGRSLSEVGWLVATYPAVWGVAQLATGPLSDRWGRKWLIAGGMVLQAVAIAMMPASSQMLVHVGGAVLLGLGTAMVYPTLMAAIADVTHPSWRARAIGIYRLWRDLGYAGGAVLAGVLADAIGLRGAVLAVAAVTLASGVIVAVRMRETWGVTDRSFVMPAPGRTGVAGEGISKKTAGGAYSSEALTGRVQAAR